LSLENYDGELLITTQPQCSIFASGGDEVEIFVNVIGTSPLTFQWFYDDGQVVYPIGDATAQLLTLSDVQEDDAGAYFVEITDANGETVTSDDALLFVGDFFPSLNPHGIVWETNLPATFSVRNNIPVTLTVKATVTTGVLEYLWAVNGVFIASAISPSYSFSSSDAVNGSIFTAYARVAGGKNWIPSNSLKLSVRTGGNDDFRDTDGDGIPDYLDDDMDGDGIPNSADPDIDGDGILNDLDFDIDGDGVDNWEDIDVDGDGIYNDVDGDDDGDGIPDNLDPTPIGRVPEPEIKAGESAILVASWDLVSAGESPLEECVSQILGKANNGAFATIRDENDRVLVAEVVAGSVVTYVIPVSNAGQSLPVSWTRNGVPVSIVTTFGDGVASASIVADGAAYSATFQVLGSSLTVNFLPLAILEPARITRQPTRFQYISPGGTVTLRVAATGAPLLRYQWFRDGEPVLWAISSSLTVSAADIGVESGASARYSCRVINRAGLVSDGVSKEAEIEIR
jgi:hypothetical protein